MPAASRSFRLCCLSALLCIFSLFPALHAQSSEADIKAQLMGKPLYLRGFWSDDKLRFDEAGHLVGKSDATTFTLSGFEFRKVQIKQDKLILEGRRVGLELRDNKQTRVPINTGSPKADVIHIEIPVNPTGDYGPALDAIFVNRLLDLVPSLPFYWQPYAVKNFTPGNSAAGQSPPPTGTKPDSGGQSLTSHKTNPQLSGTGTLHPKLLHSGEPNFTEAARSLKYGGDVLVHFWVKPDGTVTDLSIVRPLGMGLDERALVAVQHYVFAPATQNGKPVPFELNVEVNFQVF
jgi:TonB family protein